MNRDKIKCYIYTRVSTALQVDGYSLDAQRETMRKYADFQNMEIVREYSDEGHSGKNIRGRQEYVRMLNEIDTVVIHDIKSGCTTRCPISDVCYPRIYP